MNKLWTILRGLIYVVLQFKGEEKMLDKNIGKIMVDIFLMNHKLTDTLKLNRSHKHRDAEIYTTYNNQIS